MDVFVAISVRQMLCKSGKNVSPLPGIVEETQADNVKQEKTFAKERERERGPHIRIGSFKAI